MTSALSASKRRFTRAKAACTRRTRSRSSVGGLINSCGVWAQANAPTSITSLPPRASLAAEHRLPLLQHRLPALGGVGALMSTASQLVEVRVGDLLAKRHGAEQAGLDAR